MARDQNDVRRRSVSAVRHLVGALVLGATVAQIAACANQSRLEAWEKAGWRRGWVYQIVDGKDLRDVHELPCVSTLAPARIASQRFAVVWYAVSIGARTHAMRTVPVPDSLELKVRDAVDINIRDCGTPISLAAT